MRSNYFQKATIIPKLAEFILILVVKIVTK